MKIWMNKLSGQQCLATPHWEPIGEPKFDEKFYKEIDPSIAKEIGDRKIFHGCLVQVGWLIQNEHGVWFGISLKTAEQFEEIGDT